MAQHRPGHPHPLHAGCSPALGSGTSSHSPPSGWRSAAAALGSSRTTSRQNSERRHTRTMCGAGRTDTWNSICRRSCDLWSREVVYWRRVLRGLTSEASIRDSTQHHVMHVTTEVLSTVSTSPSQHPRVGDPVRPWPLAMYACAHEVFHCPGWCPAGVISRRSGRGVARYLAGGGCAQALTG